MPHTIAPPLAAFAGIEAPLPASTIIRKYAVAHIPLKPIHISKRPTVNHPLPSEQTHKRNDPNRPYLHMM